MNLQDFIKEVLPAKNKLYRFALSYLKNEEEAEDVVQDVMVKLWKAKDSVRLYKSMEAWCMTMTKNLSLDRLKSKQYHEQRLPEESILGGSLNNNPYEETALNDTLSQVNGFMEQLPDKQKEVMYLRDVEEYSYKEISDILKIDMNQVKVNLFRARKTVKQKLLKIENHGN